MLEKIVLSAEEIYYLAKFNNGKFLDYDYISAMEDIGDNRSLFEEKCRRSLAEKKILEEDFDGNISMSSSFAKLIEPVYKGDYESVLSFLDGTEGSLVLRLHKMGEEYTLVSDSIGGFELKNIDEKSIEAMIETALNNYTVDDDVPDTADKDGFNLVIIIKGVKPEERSIVNVFYGNGKGIYEEQDDGSFKCVDKEEVFDNMLNILKGV